jgi:hypothetical protein
MKPKEEVMKKKMVAVLLSGILVANCVPCLAEDSKPQAEPGGGAVAAAVVSDIFYIPGKAGTCALSGI